jgi:hypothetical protein
MTRREWLQRNPPPRAAAQLRVLLAQLEQQSAQRTAFAAERTKMTQHVSHWQSESYNARGRQDNATVTYATSQAAAAQAAITEIDKMLKETEAVPAEIARINGELRNVARCAKHGRDLVRHNNRPEDLFVCDVGPHYLLWTAPSSASSGTFLAVDTSRPFPELDKSMD